MAQHAIEFYRKKVNQIGFWAGVRYLRNRGVSFENAYLIIFGRPPVVRASEFEVQA